MSAKAVNKIAAVMHALGPARGLVSISNLRAVLLLDHGAFDSGVLELAAERGVNLHRHDHQAGLTGEEREAAVRDPETGAYYIGIALSKSEVRLPKSLDAVIDEVEDILGIADLSAVPIPALRQLIAANKKTFDTAVLTLRDEGVVKLHAFKHPESIDEDGRYKLVQDSDKSAFYIGISKARKSK